MCFSIIKYKHLSRTPEKEEKRFLFFVFCDQIKEISWLFWCFDFSKLTFGYCLPSSIEEDTSYLCKWSRFNTSWRNQKIYQERSTSNDKINTQNKNKNHLIIKSFVLIYVPFQNIYNKASVVDLQFEISLLRFFFGVSSCPAFSFR